MPSNARLPPASKQRKPAHDQRVQFAAWWFRGTVNHARGSDRLVKAHAVYLSIYQLLPYERVQSMLVEQYGIPLSVGSIANFNREAGERALPFEAMAKKALIAEAVLHADETSINLGGTKHWLHAVSCERFTLLMATTAPMRYAMPITCVN